MKKHSASSIQFSSMDKYLQADIDWARETDLAKAICSHEFLLKKYPNHTHSFVVHYNLGVLLTNCGKFDLAISCFKKVLKLKPNLNAAKMALVLVYEKAGNIAGALSSLDDSTEDKAGRIALLNQRGRIAETAGLLSIAENELLQSLLLEPNQPDVISHYVHIRGKTCRWPTLAPVGNLTLEQQMAGMGLLQCLAISDDLQLLKKVSESFVVRHFDAGIKPIDFPTHTAQNQKLKIGFLSSDFCMHTVSIAGVELFELLDRDKFETFAFDVTPTSRPKYDRVIRAFDHCHNLLMASDEDAARIIFDCGIDILIDLNGLTVGARLGILKYKPAPIQITWLGSLGSTGMKEVDYILLDEFVVTEELEKSFSEKPLCLPGGFHVNDSKRYMDTSVTRRDCGLPEDRFIFCCINNNYKITYEVFQMWGNILKGAPNSVLWLLADNAASKESFQYHFQNLGLSPDRLFFAERTSPEKYLGRLRNADLFLDTFPYNAGATTADALFAGLPVLTRSGKSVSSRIAGSILTYSNLGQLVVDSALSYQETAIFLATNPTEYQKIRAQVRSPDLMKTPYFNTPIKARAFGDILLSVHSNHLREQQAQPTQIQELIAQGLATHQQGNLPEAEAIYEQILKIQPDNFSALQLMGAIYMQRNNNLQAIEFLSRAIKINPQFAPCYNNIGIALKQLKHLDEALASFDKAISITHDFLEAHCNRGNALLELGRPDEALASHDKAISIKPDSADAHYNRGSALQGLGRPDDEALASYDKAISIKPDYADAYANRGNALLELGRPDEALASYDKAISIKPDSAEARWFRAISALPIIQSQTTHTQDCRADFHTRLLELDNWFAREQLNGGDKAVGSMQPFYIAYQEENNKELLSQYGALCCKLMKYWQHNNNYHLESRLFKKPIRLGIVSNHIREHSVWSALTRGWAEHLNHDDFQLFFFCTGTIEDSETQIAKSIATDFIRCGNNLNRWVDAIFGAQIDVLLYPEIGMDVMTKKLASLRLAPVQVGSWGHPETTGLPTLDYYLSAELLEPNNAEEYYSEQLIKLPNLGCYYKKELVATNFIDLEKLGIATDQPLLICPGTPYKYQAKYDHVFVDIAKQLEKCQLIFFIHKKSQYTELLKKRIASRFLEAGLNFKDYCVFIPWLPKVAFYSLMRQADVFLDTIGFSGFNTAMQALECELPIVTREGKFMRGRLASGILKRIGLTELIAQDEGDYVNLVINLIQDQEYNQSIRQYMKDNCDTLYNDLEPVRALEKFLERACLESTK